MTGMDTWSVITSAGSKSLLSHQGFKKIVDTVQAATMGGVSMSLTKVKRLVSEQIKFEWYLKFPNAELPKICNTLHLCSQDNVSKSF